MTDENLELAFRVMGSFIDMKDPAELTKAELVRSLGFDEKMAEDLAKAAYKEWCDAYDA